jgi:hypothetical protein
LVIELDADGHRGIQQQISIELDATGRAGELDGLGAFHE